MHSLPVPSNRTGVCFRDSPSRLHSAEQEAEALTTLFGSESKVRLYSFIFPCGVGILRTDEHEGRHVVLRYQITENLRTLRMLTPLIWSDPNTEKGEKAAFQGPLHDNVLRAREHVYSYFSAS